MAGADALASGSGQLGEGLTLIADGTQSLADGLQEHSQGMAASDSVIRSQADVLATPVALDDLQGTASYGQGLAPYLAAMFLWGVCLIIGFALRPLNMRMIMAGANPVSAAFAGFIPMAVAAAVASAVLLAVIQLAAGAHVEDPGAYFGVGILAAVAFVAGFIPMAVAAAVASAVLLAVIQLAAGAHVEDPGAYFGVGILAAVAFAAATQLLMAAFGRSGGLVSAALLVLQAVCSGAAFPIQTAPSAFGALQAAMPLTYAAQGMQAAMLGTGAGQVGLALGVLAAFCAVCVALTALVAMRRRTVMVSQLHPAAA